MKPFLTSNRGLADLLILSVVDVILYLIWSDWSFIVLFNLGFIWNWVAAQNLESFFENQRYRYSTLKLVSNLQLLVLKPFQDSPKFIHSIVKSLPAGVFWSMVIYINSSSMPWWATFLGSFFFELLKVDKLFIRKAPPA